MVIRDALAADAGAIAGVYAPYVLETPITFEEVPPAASEMAARIAASPLHPWLVAEDDAGNLAGYAYARPYHPRLAYRWTCETSVYLARGRGGVGLGRALYGALLDRLAAQRFVVAMALITVPNAESTGFHEAMGFREAGRMRGVGYKLGRWHDVGYFQRDLAPRLAEPDEPRAT